MLSSKEKRGFRRAGVCGSVGTKLGLLMKLTESQSCALDWMRGLSAQAVLFGHVISANGYRQWIPMQEIGVLVFFVLSGFLICLTTVSKPETYSFTDFTIDRAARIFTPYVPAVAFIVIAGALFNGSGPRDPATIVANLAMLQDLPLQKVGLFQIDRVGDGRHLWSVAVEWWIYITFAALIFYRRGIPILFAPLIAVGLVVTTSHFTNGMLGYVWFASALGALIFYRAPKLPWLLLALFFLAVCARRILILEGQVYDAQLGVSVVALFFCGLKVIEQVSVPKWLASSGQMLAAFSYSLYLVHYSFLNLTPGWQALVWANLFAVVFWWIFERHYKKVADIIRFSPVGVRRYPMIKP